MSCSIGAHVLCDENTSTLLDHTMEHHWTNAHLPTPKTLIELVTDNPERALQAGRHIHRTKANFSLWAWEQVLFA